MVIRSPDLRRILRRRIVVLIICPCVARINGRVVPGRASGIKMVGMAEVWAPISLDGVVVYLDFLCISLCYLQFILHQKIHKMANKDTMFGYHPVGAPTCLCKQYDEKSLAPSIYHGNLKVPDMDKGPEVQVG